MNAGQRSVRRIANAPFSRDSTICTTCLNRITQPPSTRRHAATATATAPSPSPSPQDTTPPVTSTQSQKSHALLASPLISRPPLLTRPLTPFEKSYYLYQKRLNERTALPFTRYFYYREGTPSDPEWKRKMRGRKSAARDIGQYSGYGREAWNDEVLVGDKTAEWESVVECLIRDAEGKVIMEGVGDEVKKGEEEASNAALELTRMEVARPLGRETEADRKGDTRRLDRRLDRVLYLVVKNKDGEWRFPEGRVLGRESLSQTAERVIIQSCGINMNTWIVGNHPIGYHSIAYQSGPEKAPTSKQVTIPANRFVPGSTEMQREEYGQKVFFMKTRIMAGQVDLSKNEFGDQDYQWLTKEEIESLVHIRYWANVRNMLTER